jgi:phosphoglycerate dehydrogenase-like enzyme
MRETCCIAARTAAIVGLKNGAWSMTKVAVLDDWQGVAESSADWSPLKAKAEVTIFEDAMSDEDALVERLTDFDILMIMRERTRFPASLITRLPKLRMISSTGMRNAALDLAALELQGIVVSGTQSGRSGATAELALALMLAAARQLPLADATMRKGGFQAGVAPGIVLAGSTLGLIGLGNLGSLVAGYGKALGMTVLAWSPNLTAEKAEAGGAALVSKEELLRRADFVSIHMVLGPSTVGMLGAADLARMKKGAILVNTSRGPLVDETALVDALDRGAISAALDVYDQEPLPLDHPLRRTPNTILSPHLGYCVRSTFPVFYEQGIENVLAFLDGAPLRLLTRPNSN